MTFSKTLESSHKFRLLSPYLKENSDVFQANVVPLNVQGMKIIKVSS